MKAVFKQEAIITSKLGCRKGYADCQIASDSRGKTLSLLADGGTNYSGIRTDFRAFKEQITF